MTAVVPGALRVVADQAQVRLMDQGRGIERLPRRLARQPLGREPPQLVVNLRQELARGLAVAPSEGIHDLREITHDVLMPAFADAIQRQGARPWRSSLRG